MESSVGFSISKATTVPYFSGPEAALARSESSDGSPPSDARHPYNHVTLLSKFDSPYVIIACPRHFPRSCPDVRILLVGIKSNLICHMEEKRTTTDPRQPAKIRPPRSTNYRNAARTRRTYMDISHPRGVRHSDTPST